MAHRAMSREFEDVNMAGKVCADIGAGVVERIAHARLGREMGDAVERHSRERCAKCGVVADVNAVDRQLVAADSLELCNPSVLERDRIIVVEIVDADHALTAREQGRGDVHADKTGGTGNENRH